MEMEMEMEMEKEKEEFEEGEFWLPSEFLADDLFLESDKSVAKGIGSPGLFGLGSSPDSPVESMTETESDEEEYMAGLTRQMTRSFLLEDDKDASAADFAGENQKANAMASSPQSTLCPMKWLSSSGHESPNGPSQVSSSPSSPLESKKDDSWDLLSEAAGQVMRMRMEDQGIQPSFHGHQGLLAPARKPSPPPISVPPKNPNAGYISNPVHTQRQLQAAQFYHMRQQQLLHQQQQKQLSSEAWARQSRARSGEGDGRNARPLGLSHSAWPPLSKPQQPQHGSGMRAVFLNSGAKRESAGTGVFLPRSTGTPSAPRKKSTCSTVLLPARVVQALNLNLDDLGAHPRYPGGFILDRDALLGRSNAVISHQKRNIDLRPQPQEVSSHEISLPQEWTY